AVVRPTLGGGWGGGGAVLPDVEAEREAAVNEPLAVQALGEAELVHHVDGALLQEPGAHALDHVAPAAILQHDRLDVLAAQKMGQQQSGRTRSDDGNLGTHDRSSQRPGRTTTLGFAGKV